MKEWECWWRRVRGLVLRDGDGDGNYDSGEDNDGIDDGGECGSETLHAVVHLKVLHSRSVAAHPTPHVALRASRTSHSQPR
jgi:hypothetical protein